MSLKLSSWSSDSKKRFTSYFSRIFLDISFSGDQAKLVSAAHVCVYLYFPSQINMLEMEKSSSQQNFDDIVELVTEQQINADVKFEEVT